MNDNTYKCDVKGFLFCYLYLSLNIFVLLDDLRSLLVPRLGERQILSLSTLVQSAPKSPPTYIYVYIHINICISIYIYIYVCVCL